MTGEQIHTFFQMIQLTTILEPSYQEEDPPPPKKNTSHQKGEQKCKYMKFRIKFLCKQSYLHIHENAE